MKRIVTVSTLCLILASVAAFGQATTNRDQGPANPPLSRRLGKIVGSLHLSPGEHQVPEMITVTLYAFSGSYLQHRTLNQELSFTFENVASGNYTLSVQALGYQTVETPVQVDHYTTGEQTFVALTLGPRIPEEENRPPDGSRPTVRAETLQISAKARKEVEKAARESRDGKTEKAIEHLKRAVELEPEFYEAYNNLAVEYSKQRRYPEAVAALQKSLQIREDDATGHRNLAQLHMAEGRFGEAIPHLNRSLELDSENPRSFQILGQAFLALRRFEEALANLQQASSLDPQFRPHLELGQCHLYLGSPQKALAEFRAYLDTSPQGRQAEQIRLLVADLESRLAGP